MNVLVVDDDDDLRETLAELLVDCGHQVATASDGLVALLGLADPAEVPDVILLDWMMPRMDGLEFRRRQRLDPHIARIPVILMSATIASRVPLAEIDPAAALRKPVALAELLAVLRRLDGSARNTS